MATWGGSTRWLPRFNLDRCTATAWCVAACPTECLEMWCDQPGIARPNDCVSCGVCAAVCPTNAVTLADPDYGRRPSAGGSEPQPEASS